MLYGHVDATLSQTLTLSNVATGALTDVLDVIMDGTGDQQMTWSGNLTGIAAGSSATLTVTLHATQAGSAGLAFFQFLTHDGSLPDGSASTNVSQNRLGFSASVTNYATVGVGVQTGNAALFGGGSTYTLNLGNIAAGSAAPVVELDIFNATMSYADTLSGTFAASGSGAYTNSNLSAFSALSGGQYDEPSGAFPTISLATSQTGTFTQTLIITPTGSNGSGYSGSLPQVTITVIGSIVPTASFGGTTNKTFTLSGGTTGTTGTSGDENIADFTTGNATPNAAWGVGETLAGTVVFTGTNAGYSGTATLTGIQQVELGGNFYNLADTTISGEALSIAGSTNTIAIDGPGSKWRTKKTVDMLNPVIYRNLQLKREAWSSLGYLCLSVNNSASCL